MLVAMKSWLEGEKCFHEALHMTLATLTVTLHVRRIDLIAELTRGGDRLGRYIDSVGIMKLHK